MPRWVWIAIMLIVLGLVYAPQDTSSGLSHIVHGVETFIRDLGLH